jgi:hypothetical protein
MELVLSVIVTFFAFTSFAILIAAIISGGSL